LGASLSNIDTVKSQKAEFAKRSCDLHVTTVSPTLNMEPDAGVQPDETFPKLSNVVNVHSTDLALAPGSRTS
jgi:hypothetical protein